ncbi:hypothetical protein RUM43_010956 [Polyplax serrata]|uniref:Uncharacterized protein n=1 Tax=Polyplax serrata TaxID=468196 RepID=A0AAN8P5U0_POLSC
MTLLFERTKLPLCNSSRKIQGLLGTKADEPFVLRGDPRRSCRSDPKQFDSPMNGSGHQSQVNVKAIKKFNFPRVQKSKQTQGKAQQKINNRNKAVEKMKMRHEQIKNLVQDTYLLLGAVEVCTTDARVVRQTPCVPMQVPKSGREGLRKP